MHNEQTTIVGVQLKKQVDKELDYLVPLELSGQVDVGTLVMVPLRNKSVEAVVTKFKSSSPFKTLKEITSLLYHKESLSQDLLKLAEWMSNTYCCSYRAALKTILPSYIATKIKREVPRFSVTRNVTRKKISSYIEQNRSKNISECVLLDRMIKTRGKISLAILLAETKIDRRVVKNLVKKGLLSFINERDSTALLKYEFVSDHKKVLMEKQRLVVDEIRDDINKEKCSFNLIHGVTGSGKTEVYLRIMETCLNKKKQVLILVPEISLIPQTYERVKKRFNKLNVSIIHNRLTTNMKREQWLSAKSGKTDILIGTRSAVFFPLEKIGLIIIDEEHDHAFKNESTPGYHAREITYYRAKQQNAVVVLGSATPSLESYHHAKKNNINLHSLLKRPSKATLPSIKLVDMNREYEQQLKSSLIGQTLYNEINNRLALGEQVLLYLNRRGYHTSVINETHDVIKCEFCDVSLSYHKRSGNLKCHLCNNTKNWLEFCKTRQNQAKYKLVGSGTERVESTMNALFPQARIIRVDTDTTTSKEHLEKHIRQFKTGKADILIGTQMISKGHHFSGVTLVGILDIDNMLYQMDFRNHEHMFQQIVQVSGRSGRGLLPGEVIIQTKSPELPLFELAKSHDYVSFYESETVLREKYNYPPFTYLCKITSKSANESLLHTHTKTLHTKISEALSASHQISAIQESYFYKQHSVYHLEVVIKSKSIKKLASVLNPILNTINTQKVHIHVDVNAIKLN